MVTSIAHIVLEPRYSGAEILVLNLIRNQLKSDIRSSIVALKPSQSNFKRELMDLKALGCELAIPDHVLNRKERILWVRRSIRRLKPDIVFAHALSPTVYARLALLSSSVPVVSVLHTDDDYKERKAFLMERMIWRLNSAVVGVSPGSLRNYKRRISAHAPTVLIPNGVDLRKYSHPNGTREKLRRQLLGDHHKEHTLILQVGRVSTQKMQHVSVEALGLMCQEHSDVKLRLCLAGLVQSQDYFDKVQHAVRDYRIEDRVQFLGDRRDIPDLLAAADVFVMPSDHEAHSIAAIEALASGVYCIFSDIESFRPLAALPGVTVVQGSDSADLKRALTGVINQSNGPTRFTRDMSAFGIEECASQYLKLASEICST